MSQEYLCKRKYVPLNVQIAIGPQEILRVILLFLLLRKSVRGFDCNPFVYLYLYCINQPFHFQTDNS